MAKKRSPRQRVVTRLDTVLSKFIRLRDRSCVICGSIENLTNGHLFSRRSYSTRWDYLGDGNCHCQCWGCNFSHGNDPYPYNNWYIEKFGKEMWDKLYQRYKAPLKYTTPELEDIYKEVKLIYEVLQDKTR